MDIVVGVERGKLFHHDGRDGASPNYEIFAIFVKGGNFLVPLDTILLKSCSIKASHAFCCNKGFIA